MKAAPRINPVRFYCEFCGSQVRASDRICPHCGSMFSQVRCQACGFQGDSKLFLKGCPICGFTGVGQGGTGPGVTKNNAGSRRNLSGASFERGYILDDKKKSKRAPTPGWTWIVLASVLVSVIIAAAWIINSVR